MKNYKVLLCDGEEGFVVALMNYMNRNQSIPILAMAFTDVEQLMDYLKSHQGDLIVINNKWKGDRILDSVSSIPVLWIVEEEAFGQEGWSGDNYISKYSSAPAYSRRMLRILSEQTIYTDGEGKGICMAVYSPLGRCGKTRLAHALCQAQTIHTEFPDCKSIYMGMEEFGEVEDENHGMETLLYYIKQHIANLSMKIKSLAVEEREYDSIVSSLTYQELRELNREELRWFLDCIRKEGFYDLLVADIGSASLTSLELLAEFDVIYLPYFQSEYSKQKIGAFCRGLKQYGLWELFSDKCYPILWEKENGGVEKVRMLEQKRKTGGLTTLENFYKNVL
ncbi:MAG: hypothetical protein K2N24_08115 [Lachnospiraceae bacterium]|nr:hypothetical protein [Lachnospiraceae bacterium]